MQPWWVNTWACNTVMWYWSADNLFWQLLIDHNMNVQYQVAGTHTSYKVWDFTLVSLWWGRTGGRMDGHTVTWLPKFLRWIHKQIFLAVGYNHIHFTHGALLISFNYLAPVTTNLVKPLLELWHTLDGVSSEFKSSCKQSPSKSLPNGHL